MKRGARGETKVEPVVWGVCAMALLGAFALSMAMGPSGQWATTGAPGAFQVSEMVLPPVDPGVNAPEVNVPKA